MSQRIITGVVLGLAACLLIYFGGTVFAVSAIIVFCISLHEEYQALDRAGHRAVSWPTWLAMIASIPLALLFGASVVVPILIGASIITVACVIFRDEPRLEDALMSLLPLYWVVLPGLAVISLSLVSPLSVQRTLIALLITVPVLGDTFAYFVGSFVGGRKFCPAVSPNKTWSGAIGGMIGSILAAVIVRMVAGWICAPTTTLPGWIDCIVLGIVGGAASQIGDLMASLVKRHCGIKDFSNLFPGHGGMLDRLDSILLMALVLFSYRLIFFS